MLEREFGEIGTLVPCWGEWKMAQLTKETSMAVPQKTKLELLHDPAIPLLGMYPKELKARSQRDTCAPTAVAALLTTAMT